MKRGRWWSSLYKSMNISNHAFKGVEAGSGIRSSFFGAKSLVFCDWKSYLLLKKIKLLPSVFVMSDLRDSLTVPLFKKINESKRAKSERSKERIPNPGRKHGGKSGKERWKNNFIFLGRAEQSSGFYQVSDSELKVWICPLWRNITKAADQTLIDSKPADWHEDRK